MEILVLIYCFIFCCQIDAETFL